MLVFGTRPEAVKLAPLVKAFQAEPENFRTTVCVTGQHRLMLDRTLGFFGIKPDFDLNIFREGRSLHDAAALMLSGLSGIFQRRRPDLVLVHGDTVSSVSAALAAFYSRIPVGHVEAGLRTWDPERPWPEEINRQLTSRIAAWHFAPTEQSRKNLLKENISPEKIFVTGNTGIDALFQLRDLLKSKPLRQEIAAAVKKAGYDPARLDAGRDLVLITGHRRENFGQPFLDLCTAIRTLCGKYPGTDFVYPMHPNPNVRSAVREVFGSAPPANMFLIEPLDYPDFVFLMEKARVILTDSGGIQEEAPALGKPVLVMRDVTERPEALEAGTIRLVGTVPDRIVSGVSALLDSEEACQAMSRVVSPYGDGRACARILEVLRR